MINIIYSKNISNMNKALEKRNNVLMYDISDKVSNIVFDVKNNGNSAVFKYTKEFDKVIINEDSLRVNEKEIQSAYQSAGDGFVEMIRCAKERIERFHFKQKSNSWFCNENDGELLGQLIKPIEIAGCYVPGGRSPLPSSVLMNSIPAKVAGVKKIIMTTPPRKDGTIAPEIIVTANECGVNEIYKIGGAQAIAAMAFGTETIPKADKITGPGNVYVAAAKKIVFGFCDVDMIAGPSEIVVLADDTACPAFVAADLISQAEHDVLASSVLVCMSEKIASSVVKEIEKQVESLPRKETIKEALNNYGFGVICKNLKEAVGVINDIAPEHLELCVKEPFDLLGKISNAGAIFLGNYSSEPLGDYLAGPNHILPTGGTARFFSPLDVDDFIKKTNIISCSKNKLEELKDDLIIFAEKEGLTAHANAIRIRFDDK